MLHYVHLPVVSMREGPSLATKVVSQALFAEPVQVQSEAGGWVSIQTPDGYVGWVEKGSFISRGSAYDPQIQTSRISAHLYERPDTEYGPLLTLPFGSPLELLPLADPRWHHVRLPDGKEAFIQKGDVSPDSSDLYTFSQKFLHLPYTWGGRSSFGFDCSGFIQMLFAREGIRLPRDARQQIAWGKPVPFEALQKRDLLFWGKSERDIRHVGMVLEPPHFIHTSTRENKPFLRISAYFDFEWSGDSDAFYPFRTARRIV